MAQRTFSSVFRQGLFDGKVTLVTGGGSGIGRAICEELLYLGSSVVMASRNIKNLENTAKEMEQELHVGSDKLSYVGCNIRKEEEVKNMVSHVIDKFGKIDCLVNNGGGQFQSPISKMNLKGWNAVIETNLTGTFLVTRAAHDQWMKDHGGAIVNITVCNLKGFPGMAHSGAARAGVENLSKSLTNEWAHKGIRINNVAPGVVYSATAAANYPMPVFEISKPYIPFKRLGTLEEVSSAVVYLLSPATSFISGVTVQVDGGQNLGPPFWEVPEHDSSVPYFWDTDGKSKL